MTESSRIRNHRILVVDDNPSIHEDIRKILGCRNATGDLLARDMALLFDEGPAEPSWTEFEIDSAYQGQEGLAMVEQAYKEGRPHALAFVDVRMPPGWDGVETINRIWQGYPDLQIVICTAYSDYSWEEMVRQIGRTDSLVILKKPFDNIEVLQLAHALTEKWKLNQEVKCRLHDLDQLVSQRTTELQTSNDQLRIVNDQLKREIAERMQVEKALRLSEERFAKAFRASPIPLAIQSLRHETLVDANQGFQELTGFAREELIGRTPDELKIWGDSSDGTTIIRKLHTQMSIRNLPWKMQTKATQIRDTLLSAELFELEGEPFILIIAQDITEQIKLENLLRQSQKMEAVGQLAAGVAHDFNNILTVVQGHASVLLAMQSRESGARPALEAIVASGERAARLVRQLLTFSRKQPLQAKPIQIGDILSMALEMLPRVLGEHITVRVISEPALPAIKADAGMMEQLIMNLAVNARDAMPDGGKLTIRAEKVHVADEVALANQDARAGDFVCLSVSDTGCGISNEILPRIFEPFFTTKPVGKGTGLGLATVYGIAKQHEGWVEVQSQLDQGSTFKVLIPIIQEVQQIPVAPPERQTVAGGCETILVVEDEDPVREFVTALLESSGYAVVAARSGRVALDQWANRVSEIDLLLTDMVMPDGINGRELARRLLVECPTLKVIYTSGYSPGMAGNDLALLEGGNFLAKPYPPTMLLQMLRATLDRRPQSNTKVETVPT